MANPPPDPAQIQALIESKRREVAERLQRMQRMQQANASVSTPVGPSAGQRPSPMTGVATNATATTRTTDAKQRSRVSTTHAPQASMYSARLAEKRGGLAAPAHPSIEHLTGASSASSSSKRLHPLQGNVPKAGFATIKANQRGKELKKEIRLLDAPADFSDPNKNPHYDPNLAAAGAKHRGRRQFNFVGQGTFVRQADKMRAQAQLERLRKEIAASAEKAGMEMELDIATDKQIRGDPPPDVEWWDEPLLINRTYDDVGLGQLLLAGEGSAITQYVQHPVPIPGPQDLKPVAPRPLMLTTKEQKKLRRQQRMEVLKDKQDKIRLVKMSNLMRVLGNEAIQDPTKMEAYRQVAHMKANEERKLTDEERRDKRQRKLDEDAAKGIQAMFKVETNAIQLGLTGAAIISSRFSVVIVEGGPKLMLRRIKWSDLENEDENEVEAENGNETGMDTDDVSDGKQSINRCILAWEGETKGRTFRTFRFRRCPTEGAAKEFLTHHRADHYWDIARNIQEEDIIADSNQLV
ncbi:pre-mRNA processing factor 3-domain-containing protein [Syncephalis fuscata]|nr:pre-mRNA processing factor 3-domain-containing protein [Syncephalis fuscata]